MVDDAAGGDAVDSSRFRQVLGHFCTGIVIVTAADDDGPVGLTCQSFSSLSLDPPLVLFCPSKSSSSWPRIKATGRFAANVLAADQEELSRRFATSGIDKFAGVGWRPGRTGAPVLHDVLAHVECELEFVHEGGDHDIAVGRVVDLEMDHEGRPLLFFRGGYGRLEP